MLYRVQQREIDLDVNRVAHCSLYFFRSSEVRKSRNKKKKEFLCIMLVNKKCGWNYGQNFIIWVAVCNTHRQLYIYLLLYTTDLEAQNKRIVLLNMHIKNLETL